MTKGRWVWVAALTAAAMFVVAPAAQAALLQSILAPPTGGAFPAAKGKARFEDRGGEQRFRVEVQQVALPDTTTLDVFVDGTNVGTITLIAQAGALRLNSDLGQTVPAVASGSLVEVKAGADVVVSGNFS